MLAAASSLGKPKPRKVAPRPVLPSTEALHQSLDAAPVPPGAPEAAPARKEPRLSAEFLAAARERPTAEMPAWSLMLSPGERLNAAVRMMERGDFVSAVATVEQLLTDEPSHLDALLTVGNLYSLTGRMSDARDAFGQALNREPLCVEARVFGGLAALQAGELAEARAELGKALFLEPSLAIGHYLMAQVHERLSDNEAARRSYRNAIAQLRFPQRPLAGHYPELPDSAEAISRAARYALAALEEGPLL